MNLREIITIAGMLITAGPCTMALDSTGQPLPADPAKRPIALYVFSDTLTTQRSGVTVPVIDKSTANWIIRDLGPAPYLDLRLEDAAQGGGTNVSSTSEYLQIEFPNLIRSTTAATKIIDACKVSNELTLEMWVENVKDAISLVNNEASDPSPGVFRQSLRLMSLADTYFKEFHNFGLFQGYDSGNVYKATTRTTGNSPRQATDSYNVNINGDFVDPLLTSPEAFFRNRKQHVIFTKNSSGVASFYVSDAGGNLYLASRETTRFGGSFSNWHSQGTSVSLNTPDDNLGSNYAKTLDLRLAIGNEPSALYDFAKTTSGGESSVDPIKRSRHWPWMGRLYMAAIYCKALSEQDILGARAPNAVSRTLFNVNTTGDITSQMRRAQNIFTRITNTKIPIDSDVIRQMADIVDSDPMGAAQIAMNHPNFLNITVRDFAAIMSNREGTINVPLNDFTATVIGAVRDRIDSRRLLYDNITYHADTSVAGVPSDLVRDILTSNRHYESITAGNFSIKDILIATPAPQKLYRGTGDSSNVVDNTDSAGLLTSRAFMMAHAVAGTNRRPVEYAFKEFLCSPIEKWANTEGSDAEIGRDIDRFPGGSHAKFTESCRGCHTRLDPFRSAFAYYTFSNNFVKHSQFVPRLPSGTAENNMAGMATNLIPGDPALQRLSSGALAGVDYVSSKMNHNHTVFPDGKVITSDNFVNSALDPWGQNYFGWKSFNSGKGVKAFGQGLANSDQFAKCMARRVFASVCKRDAVDGDSATINSAAEKFATLGQGPDKGNYDLNFLFKYLVVTPNCIGEVQQ